MNSDEVLAYSLGGATDALALCNELHSGDGALLDIILSDGDLLRIGHLCTALAALACNAAQIAAGAAGTDPMGLLAKLTEMSQDQTRRRHVARGN